ncbi:MAG: hypothetical protein QOG83_774 [Alphaproteobacteria bacterium]|nr:hypothetical protein [Alphaproteobacteria bacterium]
MTRIPLVGHWLQRRRNRKASAFGDEYIDIVDLCKNGLVSASGAGQSITIITAEIVSRVGVPVKVSVPRGTYFVARGNHQNMVARREYRFILRALGAERIRVPATCINASLPVPTDKDRFKGVSRVSDDVRRFIEAAEAEEDMTIQAGVWSLTDGFSREKIQSTLRKRRPADARDRARRAAYAQIRAQTQTQTQPQKPQPQLDTVDDGPAISDDQIDRAMVLLDSLGIKHNLYRDICNEVAKGEIKQVRELLARDPSLVSRVAKIAGTPLHIAASRGNIAMVELLLTNKADVNAGTFDGTPLHVAAMNGQLAVVELLIANKAEINNTAKHGQETPLHLAASFGDIAVAQVLLAHGADINAKNLWGDTPLHHVGRCNPVKGGPMAELLTAQGADVNAKAKQDITPLHKAASHGGGREVAEVLLAHGADVNAKAWFGKTRKNTPLHQAATYGQSDTVELLLAYGADPNARNSRRKTPLQEATDHGCTAVVELLRAPKAPGSKPVSIRLPAAPGSKPISNRSNDSPPPRKEPPAAEPPASVEDQLGRIRDLLSASLAMKPFLSEIQSFGYRFDRSIPVLGDIFEAPSGRLLIQQHSGTAWDVRFRDHATGTHTNLVRDGKLVDDADVGRNYLYSEFHCWPHGEDQEISPKFLEKFVLGLKKFPFASDLACILCDDQDQMVGRCVYLFIDGQRVVDNSVQTYDAMKKYLEDAGCPETQHRKSAFWSAPPTPSLDNVQHLVEGANFKIVYTVIRRSGQVSVLRNP